MWVYLKRWRLLINKYVFFSLIVAVYIFLARQGVFQYINATPYEDYLKAVYDEEYLKQSIRDNELYLSSSQAVPCRPASAGNKSKETIVFVVKSAVEHFGHRTAIRRTWGAPVSTQDVTSVVVFLVGRPAEFDSRYDVLIDSEKDSYKDIIQGEFIDVYYNNTLKTMMGLQWAHTLCHGADHFVFVDDDYYVSLRNVVRFVRKRRIYPLDRPSLVQYNGSFTAVLHRHEPLCTYLKPKYVQDDSTDLLFAGYVFSHPKPVRVYQKKWWVGLQEWPYETYPPYITGGVFILSPSALHGLYHAALRTAWFRIDDVFLGMAAMRACIPLTHSPHMYSKRPKGGYEDMIASHGFSSHNDLARFWDARHRAGHA